MKYDLIYADPPWQYRDKGGKGIRGASQHYSVMGPADIAALPVEELAADDAALFMWATMPLLPVAFEVMSAWGFEYKTVAFTWLKRNKTQGGYRWGMGSWTRANAELVLLGTRGKIRRVSAGVHSVVCTVPGKHSAKPNEVADRIVDLMGDRPRLELFVRGEPLPGWHGWGNECEGPRAIDLELLDAFKK